MTLPLVQAGLLASVIVLGAMAALVVRLPLPAGMALAALFGLLHGHVHGEEMLGAVALSTAAGFLAATALLHGVGLALAMPVAQRMAPWARRAMQVAGGATAVAGVLLAVVG
ncbi:HupE/UreJ family protein [Siccirubricoccus sp. G192]|uniref:HupE/UreJ family protein n=1 Tax=Siccirubricoccus sp. G192 TaxID=2849651 RepID=UPI0020C42F1C|nr:HupE/UreJ family protein [Siccirubricoccus sp. G192]